MVKYWGGWKCFFVVYLHSSLKRGSAFGPTLPNVLMISMCKECWSWYWGSSRKDASCIFTRSCSYTHIKSLIITWLNESQHWIGEVNIRCVLIYQAMYLFLCDRLHDGAKSGNSGDPHRTKNSRKQLSLWPYIIVISIYQVLSTFFIACQKQNDSITLEEKNHMCFKMLQ